MAYAGIADILTRYRPLETMVGSGEYDVSSNDVSSVFLSDAEAFIDARLSVRYVVPLVSANPLITRIACDLATHQMLAEKMPSVPEFMETRFQRANEMLDQLVRGDLRLNSETLVGSSGDSFAWSSTLGRHPIFAPVIDAIHQAPDRGRVNEEFDARKRDIPNP
jgi:phage gp36-like protein